MGSFFPALDVKQGNPLQTIAEVNQLKNSALQQQMGQVELENARRDQNDQRITRQALQESMGNFSQTAELVAQRGGSPKVVMDLQNADLARKTALAKLSDEELGVAQKENTAIADKLDAVKALPAEERGAAFAHSLIDLAGSGVRPDTLRRIAPYGQDLSDASIQNHEVALRGQGYYLTQENKAREVAAAETTAKAREQEAATNAAKFAASPEELARKAAAGDKDAQATLDQQSKQAGAVAGAQEAARFPYQMKLEQIRQQVAQSQQINKDAKDKIETSVLKPYQDKSNDIDMARAAIAQAESNPIAARAAVFKMVGVAQPTGSHRVLPMELTAFKYPGGVGTQAVEHWNEFLKGAPWTPDVAQAANAFIEGQQSVADKTLNKGIDNTNKLYGTSVGAALKKGADEDHPFAKLGGKRHE